MNIQTADILKHLGTIKNELLIFTVLAALMTNGFARSLVGSTDRFTSLCGVCMHLSTIPMLIGFGMFYAYASLKLPSSTQELMFENSARKALEAHTEALEATTR
jgi:hypothetical protein